MVHKSTGAEVTTHGIVWMEGRKRSAAPVTASFATSRSLLRDHNREDVTREYQQFQHSLKICRRRRYTECSTRMTSTRFSEKACILARHARFMQGANLTCPIQRLVWKKDGRFIRPANSDWENMLRLRWRYELAGTIIGRLHVAGMNSASMAQPGRDNE